MDQPMRGSGVSRGKIHRAVWSKPSGEPEVSGWYPTAGNHSKASSTREWVRVSEDTAVSQGFRAWRLDPLCPSGWRRNGRFDKEGDNDGDIQQDLHRPAFDHEDRAKPARPPKAGGRLSYPSSSWATGSKATAGAGPNAGTVQARALLIGPLLRAWCGFPTPGVQGDGMS